MSSNVDFSDFDFIRLYCAVSFKNRLPMRIKVHELEKKLFNFYSMSEYSELFQGMKVEEYTDSHDSYLSLEWAFEAARLVGLISNCENEDDEWQINCDDALAREIINGESPDRVNKMLHLIKDLTMSKNEATYPSGDELELTSDFIQAQVDSYKKLLRSPIIRSINKRDAKEEKN